MFSSLQFHKAFELLREMHLCRHHRGLRSKDFNAENPGPNFQLGSYLNWNS